MLSASILTVDDSGSDNRLYKAKGKTIIFQPGKKLLEGNHPPSDVTGWCCSIGKEGEKRIFY